MRWSRRIASCRLVLVQAPFSSSWAPTPSDFCAGFLEARHKASHDPHGVIFQSALLRIGVGPHEPQAKAGSAQAILGYRGYSIDRVLLSNIPASCTLHTPARGLTSTRYITIQKSRFGRPRLSIQLEALYNLARSIEKVQMQLMMHHGHNLQSQRRDRINQDLTFVHVDLKHASGASRAARRQLQRYSPSMHSSSQGIFFHYQPPTPPLDVVSLPLPSFLPPGGSSSTPPAPPSSPLRISPSFDSAFIAGSPMLTPFLPPQGGPSSTPPTPPSSPLQISPPSESALTMKQEFEFVRELQKRLELIWDRENEELCFGVVSELESQLPFNPQAVFIKQSQIQTAFQSPLHNASYLTNTETTYRARHGWQGPKAMM
ncbi:hypothetical protein P692DRAFT_20823564 [Suillus brevipes Sb2]|nr:hypothetical protein P692DRAFT_20823564 [Suillus brevipes Sb2]